MATHMGNATHGDQGIHNMVLRLGRVPTQITYLRNWDGPVYHSRCQTPGHAHSQDPVGKLRNEGRTMVAAIVHQYDRCSYLRVRVPLYYKIH